MTRSMNRFVVDNVRLCPVRARSCAILLYPAGFAVGHVRCSPVTGWSYQIYLCGASHVQFSYEFSCGFAEPRLVDSHKDLNRTGFKIRTGLTAYDTTGWPWTGRFSAQYMTFPDIFSASQTTSRFIEFLSPFGRYYGGVEAFKPL